MHKILVLLNIYTIQIQKSRIVVKEIVFCGTREESPSLSSLMIMQWQLFSRYEQANEDSWINPIDAIGVYMRA
ncbi:MAG: hypothetical protein PHR59_02845, partial [Candidatus Cloacimonetes bacterium]|nr:hypothetical protein [Candidatus Cloacimonadota bacterium]